MTSAPGPKKSEDFSDLAEGRQPGFLAEYWDFLIHNGKWWLFPVVLVLLVVGALVLVGGSAAAPFLYTLF